MFELEQALADQPQIVSKSLQVIENQQLAPSLLFVGPNSAQKRALALNLVASFLCEQRQTGALACGRCPSCLRMASEQHESLLLIEPEKDLIKIEQARKALEFLSLKSLSRRRFVIIDRAECMNTQTSNALLKALEEPPPQSHFILVTSYPSRLLATIRSRCQVWRFVEPQSHPLQAWQNNEDGPALRDLGLRLLARSSAGDYYGLPLDELREMAKNREKFALFMQFLLQVLRDMQVLELAEDQVVHGDHLADLKNLCEQWSPQEVQQIFQRVLSMEEAPRRNLDLSLTMENFALQLWQMKEGAPS